MGDASPVPNTHDDLECLFAAILRGRALALQAVDEQAVFQSMCDSMVESGLFQAAWFGLVPASPPGTLELVARSGGSDSFFHQLAAILERCGDGPTSLAVAVDDATWVRDLRAHAPLEPIRTVALEHGFHSVISIPIPVDDHRRGALTLYCAHPDRFGKGAISMLERQTPLALDVFRRQTDPSLDRVALFDDELRQLLDVVPLHFTLADCYGAVVYHNRAIVEYNGPVMANGGTGTQVKGTIHPDDVETLLKAYAEGFSTQQPFEVECRNRRKDGQYRWFLFQATPLRDRNGEITRWCTTGIDIEDRKQAEERTRKENLALREEIDRASMFEEIVGHSAKLRAVLGHVSKVARTDSTVLIMGETGTGKELIARAIHRRSARSNRAFVAVNCAAIPSSLIASELFGHEKGAFTGATQQRLGRFELADGGTLFLDEVGELPAEIQIALLRVLQEREVERLGGKRPISVDVRLITATNRDLDSAVADGAFRSDLFYRLSVFPIQVPSLRERPEDIPLLVEYFTGRFASKMGKKIKHIAAHGMEIFRSYGWPGNVRELQNVVERAVVLSDGDTLVVDEGWLRRETAPASQRPSSLKDDLIGREKQMIEAALRESGGRVSGPSGAARKLGIPAPTLESKIRSLGINKHRFKGL